MSFNERCIWWSARIAVIFCLGVILASMYAWISLKELGHDEFERAHSAWLMNQGKVIYTDFFDHKPPYYPYFLSMYYKFHGDDVGVFIWGRKWQLFTFALSLLMLYWLGRILDNEVTGLAAASMLAANKLAHYPATQIYADGWMLLLLLLGLCLYLRAWRAKFRWWEGLAAGACLGLSFAVLPKSGFAILALALCIAFDCQFNRGWGVVRERWRALAVFAVAAFTPILAPFFVYGPKYFFYNYVVATHLEPPHPPWYLFVNLFSGSFGLMPFALLGLGVCVAMFVARKDRRLPELAIVLFALACFFQVIANRRPFVQAIFVFIPFICLLAGRALGWIAARLTAAQQAAGISLFALCALLLNVVPAYWDYPDNISGQFAYINQLNQVIPRNETYAGPMVNHPIFREDSTYYFWDIDLGTLQSIDPNFRHDFVAEFKKRPPLVIHKEINAVIKNARDPAQFPVMDRFLQDNYQLLPNAPLYIRKNYAPPR